jgi:hypothetical protein
MSGLAYPALAKATGAVASRLTAPQTSALLTVAPQSEAPQKVTTQVVLPVKFAEWMGARTATVGLSGMGNLVAELD